LTTAVAVGHACFRWADGRKLTVTPTLGDSCSDTTQASPRVHDPACHLDRLRRTRWMERSSMPACAVPTLDGEDDFREHDVAHFVHRARRRARFLILVAPCRPWR
jgi:hypothetical protein